MRRDRLRSLLVWALLGAVVIAPIWAAAASPLLAWRQPVYIVAGFAGILAMCLLLLQPLLAARLLPGIAAGHLRRAHRWAGVLLVLAVFLHVAGLWLTSPPDVIDALLFRSPTPFSDWGVIAMWCVFAAALAAFLRRRLRWRLKTWQRVHSTLAAAVVAGAVAHALLIEGTMEPVTKVLLCVAAVLATIKAIRDLKIWPIRPAAGAGVASRRIR